MSTKARKAREISFFRAPDDIRFRTSHGIYFHTPHVIRSLLRSRQLIPRRFI